MLNVFYLYFYVVIKDKVGLIFHLEENFVFVFFKSERCGVDSFFNELFPSLL